MSKSFKEHSFLYEINMKLYYTALNRLSRGTVSWKRRGPQTGRPGILPACSPRRRNAAFGNTCRRRGRDRSEQNGHRWWTICGAGGGRGGQGGEFLDWVNLFVRLSLKTHLPMKTWQALHLCVENLCLRVRSGYRFLSRQSLLWASLEKEPSELCLASRSWRGEQLVRAFSPAHAT